MVITAFKHERDLYLMQFPLWFHLPPTLKHFHLLFTQTWFGTWVVNTTAVSVWVVGITLAAAVPAAYALSRLRLVTWGAPTWPPYPPNARRAPAKPWPR